jgi:putative chitinase
MERDLLMLDIFKLQIIVPTCKVAADIDLVVKAINEAFPDSTLRQAAFIAQCAHESAGFTRRIENLNYSGDRLPVIFPKYFPDEVLARSYHRQPEKIANVVYANRMGNGPTASGEGWKFRGRGYIQLTGKDNYTKCGKDIGVDLVATPEYLETPKGAVASAIWFWNMRKLSDLADEGDMMTITKKINGGTHGLSERLAYYDRALEVLKT